MAAFQIPVRIRHWNDRLFSFATERAPEFRFENGHLDDRSRGRGKPLGASIASPNYSRSSSSFRSRWMTGRSPRASSTSRRATRFWWGRSRWARLCSVIPSGPEPLPFRDRHEHSLFLSIIRDPEAYERFEKVILVHGVRQVSDLAYRDYLESGIREDEYLGEWSRQVPLFPRSP